MQPKFSVVLIAKNEAKTLPRLVASLKEFQERGGEILVLDTGSTDGTPSVAAHLGCKVHEVGDRFRRTITKEEFDRINELIDVSEGYVAMEGDTFFDYAGARNYIADFASNDMIATPDCDEIFTRFDIDRINEEIEKGADQLEYNFVFSHDAQGNEVIKFMHSKFYNRKKMRWSGVIHEVLVSNENINRVFLDESIIKLEHFQNVETNRDHYLKGLALSVVLEPDNDRHVHYFGRELLYTNRFKSAIKQLEAHIAMDRWPTERSQSMVFLGDANLYIGNRAEAISWYAKAFDLEPNRREPLMKLAELYWKENKPDQVIAYACAALQVRGGNFYANFQPYYENLPHELLYWALWQKGEVFDSKMHFDICLSYQPFNSKYLHDMRWYYTLPKMSFVIPTLGRPEGLKKCIDSIRNLNYPQDRIEIVVVHDGDEDKGIRHEGVVEYFNKERCGVPKSLKLGVQSTTGDWIVYASNDIEFSVDSIMAALKTAMDNKKWFMAFNTGPVSADEGNICEHFMIHRKLLPQIGDEIFDTDFHHVGVDNLLWAKMKKLGQAMRCERAEVRHNHFSKGGEVDEVTKIAWDENRVREDRDLLQRKLAELDQEKINFKG